MHWKAVLVAIGGLLLVLTDGSTRAQQASPRGPRCEALELAAGPPEYNDLVCDGIEAMKTGRHQEAAERFEKALVIHLHEVPNVALFTRLASAYHQAGDRQRALENIERAELSLNVLTGAVRCLEPRGLSRDGVTPIVDRHANEIEGRMCGAAYEYIYEQKTWR